MTIVLARRSAVLIGELLVPVVRPTSLMESELEMPRMMFEELPSGLSNNTVQLPGRCYWLREIWSESKWQQ